jgi:hypothetical protein
VRLFRVVKTLYGMHPPMLSVRQSSDVMVELHDMSLLAHGVQHMVRPPDLRWTVEWIIHMNCLPTERKRPRPGDSPSSPGPAGGLSGRASDGESTCSNGTAALLSRRPSGPPPPRPAVVPRAGGDRTEEVAAAEGAAAAEGERKSRGAEKMRRKPPRAGAGAAGAGKAVRAAAGAEGLTRREAPSVEASKELVRLSRGGAHERAVTGFQSRGHGNEGARRAGWRPPPVRPAVKGGRARWPHARGVRREAGSTEGARCAVGAPACRRQWGIWLGCGRSRAWRC